MKRLLIATCLLATPALAQGTPPTSPGASDATAAIYRQLLTEANDRVVNISAQAQREVQTKDAEIIRLKKEIEEVKAKTPEPPKASPVPPGK